MNLSSNSGTRSVGIVISLEKNIADVNKQMLNLTSTTDNAARSVEDASKSVSQIAKERRCGLRECAKSSEGIEQMSKAMAGHERPRLRKLPPAWRVSRPRQNTANASAKSGAILAEKVNKDMMDITTESGRTYDVIKEIEKQMTDIGKIIVLIRDLASQTNLLGTQRGDRSSPCGRARQRLLPWLHLKSNRLRRSHGQSAEKSRR